MCVTIGYDAVYILYHNYDKLLVLYKCYIAVATQL